MDQLNANWSEMNDGDHDLANPIVRNCADRTASAMRRFGGGTQVERTMRGLSIVIAGAAAFAGILQAGPAQAQFAIALDTTTGKAVAFPGTTDAARNQREALSSCNSRSCQIVATGKKTCAAVAETLTTGGSIWAVGYGTTTSVAEQAAWFNCRNKGGVNCKTAAAICD